MYCSKQLLKTVLTMAFLLVLPACATSRLVCTAPAKIIGHDVIIAKALKAGRLLSIKVVPTDEFVYEAKSRIHLNVNEPDFYQGFFDDFGKAIFVRQGCDKTNQTVLHEITHSIRFANFPHKEFGALPYEYYPQSVMREEECIADLGSAILLASEGSVADVSEFYPFCRKPNTEYLIAAKAAVEKVLADPPECEWVSK